MNQTGRIAVLLGVMAVLLLTAPLTARSARNYHPYPITTVAAANPGNWHGLRLTHIEIQGYVTYIKREADGDLHIRVCDSPAIKTMDRGHCMVTEEIPTLRPSTPFPKLKVGDHVDDKGIGRFDAETPGHNWWELHPLESVRIIQ